MSIPYPYSVIDDWKLEDALTYESPSLLLSLHNELLGIQKRIASEKTLFEHRMFLTLLRHELKYMLQEISTDPLLTPFRD